MTYTINRSYVHRTYGTIGSVELIAPDGKYVLNGKELPPQSVEHLLTFALQTLQDAYAGSDNADEAVGAFNGKLDKIIAGTIGTRSGGGGVDEFTSVARSVVRSAVKAKLGAKSPQWATFTGLDDADQNDKLDEWFTANESVFRPAVEAKIAERKAERERKAKLAGKVEFTL